MSLLQTEGRMLRSCPSHAQIKGKPVFLKVACFRLPGSNKPSKRWTGVMEAAQKGIIAKLRILSMDVVMATNDGSDRCLLSLPSLQPSMPCGIRKQPLGGAQSNLPGWTLVQSCYRLTRSGFIFRQYHWACCCSQGASGLGKDPIGAVANTLYSSDELCKEGPLQQGPLQGFVFQERQTHDKVMFAGCQWPRGKIPLWQSPTHCTALMTWQRGPPRPPQRRRPGGTWGMERGLKMLKAQTWWT